MKVKVASTSEDTEALKLWDTTQYGVMIVLNKLIKKYCDENGLDFNLIYTEANFTYNDGYRKLDMPYVNRPYLRYVDGKIGGHCVIPNCGLLDSDIASWILNQNTDF